MNNTNFSREYRSSWVDDLCCAGALFFGGAGVRYLDKSHRFCAPLYRMKEMAAYLMLVLGGNESPTADDVTTALSTVGVEPDSEQLGNLISELEGKDLNEVIASGETMLAKFGSGGGGGGGGGTYSSIISC